MFGLDSTVDGLKFSAMQEAEASAMSLAHGNRILTTHLAKETHQPAQTLGADRSLALWLNDFPVLHSALTGSVLSRSHVVELKSIDCHDIHHLMIRDQELFIDAAHHLVWTDFKGVVAYWLNAAKPDGELSDPSDPKYGMRVRTKANGDIIVTIHMDPITGEAFLKQRGQCNLGTQTPFRWLQADHIKPASKHGPTNLANGQMINGGENQAKRDK